ncbi:hypothetical protein [Reinekea blandensis]|uniref:Uncharacterized protein n=1 Tax=Reinekea blandensis MED297 TaxID=314283 RepID=A4BEU5_9GAMM|nr:hypothetical protein [Reinekea blandensis]EAR09280.1 hypothetical protein MED297_18368 [Reinekea sp. MED297] [Reinekea blandensis MED297]
MMDQVVFYLLVTFCSVLPAEQQTTPFSFSYIGMDMSVEKIDQRCVFQNPGFPDRILEVELTSAGTATFSDGNMKEEIAFSTSVGGNGKVFTFYDDRIGVSEEGEGLELVLQANGQVGLTTSRM